MNRSQAKGEEKIKKAELTILETIESVAIQRLGDQLLDNQGVKLTPLDLSSQGHSGQRLRGPQRATVSLSVWRKILEVTFFSHRMRHGQPHKELDRRDTS